MVKNRAALRMMNQNRRRLLSSLRLRRTTTLSLHERFSQVLQNQLTRKQNRGRPPHQARSKLKATGLWTRFGWLKVTQQLCGFWSFKNKYGWRAQFNRRRPGRHHFLKTNNLGLQAAGQSGLNQPVRTGTFPSPAVGWTDTETGLGPRCVMMPGDRQSQAPVPTQSAMQFSGLRGYPIPVWGSATAARGPDWWKTPVPTKCELDDQLDDYMSMSKRRLDAELDQYMSLVPARLDAELDEYMSQAGQSLLD